MVFLSAAYLQRKVDDYESEASILSCQTSTGQILQVSSAVL